MTAEPCTILLIPGKPGTVCGEVSAGLLKSACVHEHVTENPVCPGCAADLQRLGGTFTCGPCDRAVVRHECLPRIVVIWAEGYREPEPVTVVQEVFRA